MVVASEYLVNHRAGAAGGWRGWHGWCALVCAGGAAGGIADRADRALAYGRWRAAGITTMRLVASLLCGWHSYYAAGGITTMRLARHRGRKADKPAKATRIERPALLHGLNTSLYIYTRANPLKRPTATQ